MTSNNNEHPKSNIEYFKNTEETIFNFAKVNNISEWAATLILILNELRCIHTHLDWMWDAQVKKEKKDE